MIDEVVNSEIFSNLAYAIIIILISIAVGKYMNNKIKLNFEINKATIISALLYGLLIFAITHLIGMFLISISEYFQIPIDDKVKIIGISNIILFALVTIIIAPICEEIIFRYGIYEFIKSKFNMIVSIIFTSVVFSVIHFYSLSGTIILVILGLLMSIVYIKKNRNILYPIIAHLIFNLFAFINGMFSIGYEIWLIIDIALIVITVLVIKTRKL